MSEPIKFAKAKLKAAHEHCVLHEAELKQSDRCGCFCCLAEFPPSDITEWIKDENVLAGKTGVTALCPRCGIDSVIGSASGYPVTQPFLKAMKKHWFGGRDRPTPSVDSGDSMEELLRLFKQPTKQRAKSVRIKGAKRSKSA